MSDEMVELMGGADRAYWRAFEQRLDSLAVTSEDPEARRDLMAAAYTGRSPTAGASPDPVVYAELAHRLRFGLGPSVDQSTLDAIAAVQARDAARLLSAGVSPELLGLVGGGVGVG